MNWLCPESHSQKLARLDLAHRLMNSRAKFLSLLPVTWLSHLLTPDLIRDSLAPEMGREVDMSLEHEMLEAPAMCHYV